MIILNQKEKVGEFVGRLIGNENPWSAYEAIGIEINGELVAGAIIDNYIENARCSIHCGGVGKNWLNRSFLALVFGYVFKQLKCNAVINIVDGNNKESLKFTEHLGFKIIYTIVGGGNNGSDAVIFEMRKKDCKWLLGDEK